MLDEVRSEKLKASITGINASLFSEDDELETGREIKESKPFSTVADSEKEKIEKKEIDEYRNKELEKKPTFIDIFDKMMKTSNTTQESVHSRVRRRERRRKKEDSIPDRAQRSMKDFFGKKEYILQDKPKEAKRKLDTEIYEKESRIGSLGTSKYFKSCTDN